MAGFSESIHALDNFILQQKISDWDNFMLLDKIDIEIFNFKVTNRILYSCNAQHIAEC